MTSHLVRERDLTRFIVIYYSWFQVKDGYFPRPLAQAARHRRQAMPDPEEEEVRVGPARRHDQAGPTAHPHRPRQGRQQEIQGPQARPGNAVKWTLDVCYWSGFGQARSFCYCIQFLCMWVKTSVSYVSGPTGSVSGSGSASGSFHQQAKKVRSVVLTVLWLSGNLCRLM